MSGVGSALLLLLLGVARGVDPCVDFPGYAFDGFSCAEWTGYCVNDPSYGYTDSQFEELLANCPVSCELDDESVCIQPSLPPSAPPFPPVSPLTWDAACKTPPSSAVVCSAGNEPDGSGGCKVCDPGDYSADGLACKPCPKGSYQPASGGTACLGCPEGYSHGLTAQTSDASCVACGPGQYGGVWIGCVACSVGSWSTSAANLQCEVCPDSTILDAAAAGCTDGDAASCARDVDQSQFCSYCPAGEGRHTYENARAFPGMAATQCKSCGYASSGVPQTSWHAATGTAVNDGCTLCPMYSFLKKSAQDSFEAGRADGSAYTTDWTAECTSDCTEVKGENGFELNDMYATCVSMPDEVTRKGVGIYTSTCAGGYWLNGTTCQMCDADTYALPGAFGCTACEEGYQAEAGAMGCTPVTALPSCADGQLAVPAVQNYDCLINQLTTGHSYGGFGGSHGCDALFGQLAGLDVELLMNFATGLSRICPKSVYSLAQNLPPGMKRERLVQLAGHVIENWGLDDDYTLEFTFFRSQLSPFELNQIGPMQTGCATMEELIESGEGFFFPANKKAAAIATGEECNPKRCNDDRFTSDWCAYPFFAVACPAKCGGVPSATIMCAEPYVPVAVASSYLGLSWEYDKPIQPPTMAACGPGWAFNPISRLIEPACGRPASMAYCPDDQFTTPLDADGNYAPTCAVAQQDPVKFQLVVAGNVEDFDAGARAQIAHKVASEASVPAQAVSVAVVSGSVTLAVTIETASPAAVVAALATGLADAAAASTLLGVEVEQAPTFTSIPPSPPPPSTPPPSTPPSSGLAVGAIVGIIVGGVVLAAIIMFGISVAVKGKKKGVSPAAP